MNNITIPSTLRTDSAFPQHPDYNNTHNQEAEMLEWAGSDALSYHEEAFFSSGGEDSDPKMLALSNLFYLLAECC
jgi:hypothetical protein